MLIALLLVTSNAHARVSIRDTNVDVIAPAKALYGQTYNGSPVRLMEVDSSGAIEIDNGAVGASFSGALTVDGVTGVTNLTATGTADVDKTLTNKFVLDAVQTFTDSDATPDVGAYSYFNTNTSAVTITDFDGAGIEAGQEITVVSKGAITYDVTASGIIGGTTDIVTADGDITKFLYDGTDWRVTSRIDQSDDLN